MCGNGETTAINSDAISTIDVPCNARSGDLKLRPTLGGADPKNRPISSISPVNIKLVEGTAALKKHDWQGSARYFFAADDNRPAEQKIRAVHFPNEPCVSVIDCFVSCFFRKVAQEETAESGARAGLTMLLMRADVYQRKR